MLESHQNIFDIIMPWVSEKKEEEKKLKAASNAASGKRSTTTQKSLSSFFKPKTPARQAKAAMADTDMADEESKDEVSKFDEEETLSILSKVIKSGSVETFNWEYTDRKWIHGRQSDKVETKRVENLQAILINPKWAEHGFDTLASTPSGTATQDSDETTGTGNNKVKKGGKNIKAAKKP